MVNIGRDCYSEREEVTHSHTYDTRSVIVESVRDVNVRKPVNWQSIRRALGYERVVRFTAECRQV